MNLRRVKCIVLGHAWRADGDSNPDHMVPGLVCPCGARMAPTLWPDWYERRRLVLAYESEFVHAHGGKPAHLRLVWSAPAPVLRAKS